MTAAKPQTLSWRKYLKFTTDRIIITSRLMSVVNLNTRCSKGTRANSLRCNAGIGKSILGTTWIGVRWYTVSSAAVLDSSGMSWTAVAPVPINPSRSPSGE